MDEARRVAIAARVRGFRARANRHGYRTLGHMGGAILVRGLDRSERVRVAMAVRGFDGTPRTLTPWQTRPADALAALVALACAASLVAWDRLTA